MASYLRARQSERWCLEGEFRREGPWKRVWSREDYWDTWLPGTRGTGWEGPGFRGAGASGRNMPRGLGLGTLTAEEASVRQVGHAEGVFPSEGAGLWRGTACAHAFYS